MATRNGGCGYIENKPLRVLFVAPVAPGLPRLHWWDELSELTEIEGAEVELVTGATATIDRVAKALRRGTDIVIFSCHGHNNELILSDGRRVGGEWLATQARRGKPEVVIVGACMSGGRDAALDSIGELVSQAGLHAVVFEVAVDDAAGAVYSTEFVRAMVAVVDVVRANRVASSMAAQVDPGTAAGARLMPGIVNGYREFAMRFESLECRLLELAGGQTEIVRRLSALEAKL